MTSKLIRILGISLVALVAFSSSAPAKTGDGVVHPEMIVSAKWLSEHLNDPKVIILHVDEKRSEYDKGHIPGARFLALEDFIVGEDAELPATEKLKDTFEKLGVNNDSRDGDLHHRLVPNGRTCLLHSGLSGSRRSHSVAGWRHR